MTQDEKMVWAAAFARSIHESSRGVLLSVRATRGWLDDASMIAARVAAVAVAAMRVGAGKPEPMLSIEDLAIALHRQMEVDHDHPSFRRSE